MGEARRRKQAGITEPRAIKKPKFEGARIKPSLDSAEQFSQVMGIMYGAMARRRNRIPFWMEETTHENI